MMVDNRCFSVVSSASIAIANDDEPRPVKQRGVLFIRPDFQRRLSHRFTFAFAPPCKLR
jgi:hypothetical protein